MRSDTIDIDQFRTPSTRPGLLAGPMIPSIAARFGVRLFSTPRRFGKTVIVARHAHVSEVLRRDLDFRIAPINEARIEQVNGPFILGMDRSAWLTAERRALYAALSKVDLESILFEAAALADTLLDQAKHGKIDAVGGYARRVAGLTARRIFGLGEPPEEAFLEVARAIFAHTFLNLTDDAAIRNRAIKAGVIMKRWILDEIAERRKATVMGGDMLGQLLAQGLEDDTVRRIIGGMLVGSIDTTSSAVAKILVIVQRDKALRRNMLADQHATQRLWGWCNEALRRWPHNPILLRQTVAATNIAGCDVPAGCRVVLWSEAAMQDAAAFPDPMVMRPDRPPAAYLHFGAELHACAGRAVNSLQVPMLMGKLLGRGASVSGPMGWAGPFPDKLPVTLEE